MYLAFSAYKNIQLNFNKLALFFYIEYDFVKTLYYVNFWCILLTPIRVSVKDRIWGKFDRTWTFVVSRNVSFF